MTFPKSRIAASGNMALKFIVTLLSAALLLGAAGCGSTKVYTADKTIVYRDNIYNLGNVQRVNAKATASLPTGDEVNLSGKDKKAINALLDEHDSFIMTTAFEMDGQQMIYQRSNIRKYSEFNAVMKRFDRAKSDVTKFMADKKKTQLKLK